MTPFDINRILIQHDEKMREHRRAVIREYPKVKLQQKHLAHARLLSDRYDMLDLLPHGGRVCEIGVANGDFSSHILKHCRPIKLHLIDAWKAERYSRLQAKVEERFLAEIKAGRVELNVGLSTDVLPKYTDHYFDWAYIDTVHDYRITAQELMLCKQKVKPGGIIAGHDYMVGNVVTPVPYGVIRAVQEFCVANDWKYVYLTCENSGYSSFAIQEIA